MGTEVEENGREDWVERAAAAREALVAADKETANNQLHYKLMLEEAHTQAATATAQVSNTCIFDLLNDPTASLDKLRPYSSCPFYIGLHVKHSYVHVIIW